ncbi:phenolphthiocerol/phthiocerol polyketide synthase subunit C-like [Ylistrum balloti]|uniref:phenolphthiocerol/phthiocerol polyketide synthase subunit C-like n=1 Tax=Ylistrum balloti TaxID=509963 RepID=UPI002905CBE8|nr:phenolphthiocerol/phthiocerol polyketide synthase subunit C-like [Ylistrum balloti]
MDEDDEIAIIGIGCRFPGANNIKEFWNVLVNGENHVKEIPRDRWNVDAVFDPDPDAYGKTYVRQAGLLSNHDVWDNVFFGIAEKEASEMDPQQRYVLECVHMALEDGGITRAELDGSSTSVYIGAMNSDSKTSKDGDYSLMTNYSVTGDSASIITARVSYTYNLLGPSITIDTACSSSLVAVNLATQSLRIGESSMAICGGVNSILYPDMFVTLTKARMASPTGQCQAFSSNADGYARGEGCGIVILEKLSDALKNDRKIWATIRTGCNQDGQTAKPITAPSEIQQNRLLHDIYLKSYHLDPCHVQYIEAHGTGTPIGDPVEVKSLGSFFKKFPIQKHEEGRERFIGSVKTNIGHLESGAGVASLVKTLLMMKHGRIVPSLHSLPRNPRIDFTSYDLDVPTSVHSWPTLHDGTRAACINCFGFGGTNSHAFLRQWVENAADVENGTSNGEKKICVPVSAKSQTCLINTIKHMATALTEEPYELKQLAYTASCKRDHYRFRKLFVESSITNLIKSCNSVVETMASRTITPSKNCRIVFMFCGVGTAWTKMGMELVKDFPVFADTLKNIDIHLQVLTGWSIMAKIRDGAEMDNCFLRHIGIFACQVGLSELWKHWGIYPDSIVGQSVGEVAAAYCSGALLLSDAVKVIYYRSKILAEESGGRMLVVRNIDTSKVKEICDRIGHVNIAVYSSPMACTISGDEEKVNEVKTLIPDAMMTKEIPVYHELSVGCAYHSYKVEMASHRIRETLEGMKASVPEIPMISTVTDEIEENFCTPEYWQRNVSEPVKLYHALRKSTNEMPTIFLEIGPKPVLKAHLTDIFDDEDVKSIPSMKLDSGSSQVYVALCEMYSLGINPQWENIVEKNNLSNLPQYQFDRKRLMVESDYRFLRKHGLIDDFSGRYLMLTQKEKEGEFKVNISPTATPFVYDHVIDDAVIIPGAVYTEVGFELGMSVMGIPAESMCVEYDILRAIPLSKGKPSYLDVTSDLTETKDGSTMEITFSIFKDTIIVAKGCVTMKDSIQNLMIPIEDVDVRTGNYIEHEEIYSELAKYGYKYGQSVQVLESITFDRNECTGVIQLTEEVARQINQTSFHPSILDAMLYSSALNFLSNQTETSNKIYPIRVGNVSVLRPFEKRMVCYTRTIQKVYDRILTNIILTRPDGLVLAEVKEIEHRIMDGSIGVNNLAYQIIWTEEDISKIDCNTNQKLDENVTIVYDDASVLDTLRGLYPLGKSFRLCDVANDTASAISSTDFEDVDFVMFVPNPNAVKQCKDTDDILYVYENCQAFLNIMKILKDVQQTVIVVTENTQSYDSETDYLKNFSGAELWGFTRSLRQEGTKCRMLLIDVQPSILSETDTLYKTVRALTSGQAYSFKEFLIVDGQLHSNLLRRRPQRGLQDEHRILCTDKQLDLQLRSTTSDKIESPFLIPGDCFYEARKNEVCLQVEEICIHSPTEFRVTELDSSLDKSLWSYYRDGYPVVGLEFQGTVQNSKHSNGQSTHVVACYPTRVANRISVPESCVCNIQQLPNYTPGLIIKAMMMWSVSQRVKRKSSVCIVTNTDPCDDIEVIILRKMLKTVKRCRVQSKSIDSFSNNIDDEFKGNVFIVLEKYTKAKLACIIRPGNTIIGFDDVISCLSNQAIQLSSKQINIRCVSKMNVFEEHNVLNTFPQVKQWLTRQQKRSDLVNAHKYMKQQTLKLANAQDEGKQGMDTKAIENRLIHNKAIYVVVGGLSGLGWEIVKWLGHKGAGVVVPLSRKGHRPEMYEQLQNAMDIHKYDIVPMSCNITNYTEVERSFCAIKELYPNHPIKGIFQGAGVLRDTRFETMDMEKFKEVLQPKVLGTWNLHLASKDLLLDFFVMHSSITSVFGNAGQTNYGAANSFLDSLASYRRSNNLPGQTINWGALSVGMASDESIQNNLEAQGYYAIEKDKIKQCLMDSLMRNPVQVIYGSFDWNIIGKKQAMMRIDMVENDESAESSKLDNKRVDKVVLDIAKFMETSFEEQRELLVDLMFNSVSLVLSIDESELDEKQDLLSLGLESQKAVELIQMMKEATGCRLPVAYILSPEYTIGMLVDFTHSNIIDNFNKEEDGNLEKKEDVKGSPSWMQKFYIDMHDSNPKEPNLWFSIDFKLGIGLSNSDIWRTVMRWITIKNPELRTMFHLTNHRIRFGMKKYVLDPEDAKVDLRIVDSSMLNREWTEQDIEKYCTFDISTDPPIRVLYCDAGKKHRIRFIMSHVTFDLQSFFTLLAQFRSHFLTYFYKKDFSVTPVENLDPSVLMEERLDAEKFYFEQFWRKELQKIRYVPSLVGSVGPVPATEKAEKVVAQFPIELVNRVISNGHGVTAPILLFCLYQILLHKMTCLSAVPVVLTVDMRQHFPEFVSRIFLGTNYIPVITEINDPNATLRELISICSSQVTLSGTGSLYPFSLIKQNDAYTKNSFRHFFNVREMSFRGERNEEYEEYYMENVGYTTDFFNDIETALNVMTDRQAGAIELVLSYNPAIICLSTAQSMIDDLLLLTCVSVTNSDFRLDDIPLLSCVSDASGKMDHHLSTVKFLKETSNGWEHPVQLKVNTEKNVPQISWKDPDCKKTSLQSNIPITNVIGVDTEKVNDSWCLIIQTAKRQYYFKTSDFLTVQSWRAKIRKLVSKIYQMSKKSLQKTT